MNMSDFSGWGMPLLLAGLFLLILVALIAAALVAVGQNRARRQQTLAKEQAEVEALRQLVSALRFNATGLDHRVEKLEQQGRDLEERQENIESRRQGEPPYAVAIRMAREGAGAERLVQELGLSEGAAELILQMHGRKPRS